MSARPAATILAPIERAKQLKIEGYAGRAFPTIYWDLFGEKGHPVRTTVTEIGPVLMARLLQLNDTQEGVLNIVFKVADEQGLLLLDFKDLQTVLQWTAENAGSLTTKYGNVSKQSIGTIQRALLTLQQQGGERFFGEPALDLKDMIGLDAAGMGAINILAADRLMQSPRLYATFLLWLLSELFEVMPEIGDPERPKFVFFFDEAHLLFNDAPKALLGKIEQVVRLIRSKGVGVYFITQNPLDIPESVLGQLGNRVQHALRAFTPRDQKAVKTAAETFRPNKKFNAQTAITELGVGEALVSFLDAKGVPEPVERCFIAPPRGRIGPATEAERAAAIKASPLAAKYERTVDRELAYEVLTGRATSGQVAHEAPPPTAGPSRRGQYDAPPPADAPSVIRAVGPFAHPADGTRARAASQEAAPARGRATTARATGAQATDADRAQGAGGTAQRFDRHDHRQDRDPHGDQRAGARGHQGRHEERRLDPARRAGLDPEVASGLDHEGAFHVLVAVAAEDVAQEAEAAGLVGHQRHARLLARHDVGAHAEVRHLEAVDAVLRGQHQHQRLAALGRDLVRMELELLGADADLGRLVRRQTRGGPQRAAGEQRDQCPAVHGSALGDRQLDQGHLVGHRDVARAQALARRRRVIGERRALGLRARARAGRRSGSWRRDGRCGPSCGDAPGGCGRRTPRRS